MNERKAGSSKSGKGTASTKAIVAAAKKSTSGAHASSYESKTTAPQRKTSYVVKSSGQKSSDITKSSGQKSSDVAKSSGQKFSDVAKSSGRKPAKRGGFVEGLKNALLEDKQKRPPKKDSSTLESKVRRKSPEKDRSHPGKLSLTSKSSETNKDSTDRGNSISRISSRKIVKEAKEITPDRPLRFKKTLRPDLKLNIEGASASNSLQKITPCTSLAPKASQEKSLRTEQSKLSHYEFGENLVSSLPSSDTITSKLSKVNTYSKCVNSSEKLLASDDGACDQKLVAGSPTLPLDEDEGLLNEVQQRLGKTPSGELARSCHKRRESNSSSPSTDSSFER